MKTDLGLDVGRYTDENKIDFVKYEVNKFQITFNSGAEIGLVPCGSQMLASLCNVSAIKISELNKHRSHTSDAFVLNYLKEYTDFKTLKLDVATLSNSVFLEERITRRHILVMSLFFCRNQASWTILHNNYLYHNQTIEKLNGLTFLNTPISSAYLVWKKSWLRYKK